MGKTENVAFMTSGGLAPCLSSAVAWLVHYWKKALKDGKIDNLSIRCYRYGYIGILKNDSFLLSPIQMEHCEFLHDLGGSPIGNSRVKLTNQKACIDQELIKEGENPLEVAAQQLLKDEITVLHTIGGDDTITEAAKLSEYILKTHGGKVNIVGLPKTIDNDVYPILQTLGVDTAADQGAIFFENVVNESTSNQRVLIVHECMGRKSGFLTAMTAKKYRERLARGANFPSGNPFVTTLYTRDIHAVWVPELALNIEAEGSRLLKMMNLHGCVNVFMCEGVDADRLAAEMEATGHTVKKDASENLALDEINVGKYFAERLAQMVHAEKVIVQKSGYFARSAKANEFDKELIRKFAKLAVESAISNIVGCIGQNQNQIDMMIGVIDFKDIKGHKPFDISTAWFQEMLKDIGQATE